VHRRGRDPVRFLRRGDDVAALSRRAFLAAGVAVAAGGTAFGLVDRGVLPGGTAIDYALGRCDVGGWPRDVPPVHRRDAVLRSRARGRDVPYTVVRPSNASGDLPLVLVLHGRGSSASAFYDALHLGAFLTSSIAGGGTPFALACAEGGDRYWHPRADGDDPLRMLTDELLPALRAERITTDPMGVLGWSMGGYGALLWARLAGEGALPDGVRLTAAVAESPALFRSYAAATRGAFDSPEDFARWGDLLARPGVPDSVALRVDCGDSDPFAAVTRAYRANVPHAEGGFTRGCHTDGYWRGRAGAQIAFLGGHLA
jgi:hypothetical protein